MFSWAFSGKNKTKYLQDKNFLKKNREIWFGIWYWSFGIRVLGFYHASFDHWTGLHFQSHGLSIIESLNFFPIMHLFLILLLGILYMTLIARISIKENILIFKNTLQGLEMTGRNTQGLVCNLLYFYFYVHTSFLLQFKLAILKSYCQERGKTKIHLGSHLSSPTYIANKSKK